MTTGEKIRYIRLELGLSQGEAADQCHTSKAMFSKWELDKIIPSGFSLLSLCNGLGVSADWLLGTWCSNEPRPMMQTNQFDNKGRRIQIKLGSLPKRVKKSHTHKSWFEQDIENGIEVDI
jgi:transcriptional regulator with XRE-family HTH domain